tara:strand:- start:45 stop:320 length:276 start_codon:yes stop_codon:yes gene_type:complete
VTGTNAFKNASFIMFQKICQIASLLSLFLTLSMLGGSYYAYRFITSEQFKARVMNEVLDNVTGMMPKVLDNAMPDMTGGTIPEFIPPAPTR